MKMRGLSVADRLYQADMGIDLKKRAQWFQYSPHDLITSKYIAVVSQLPRSGTDFSRRLRTCYVEKGH